eukprot:CAMPEP_0116871336 /NCGR_PEP_ID=MMETSP0463-20121206/1622_1 /TAXON_ID=181622 /ORGANISM="Strombidinopsis sp, Strain SopsisLIS2011" /LENGTH=35 /DNA_ID= /DNA_START= /DNA_END= /DNA_ORIENTATION=
MSYEEFVSMVETARVCNETFGAREVGPLWNMSMMT